MDRQIRASIPNPQRALRTSVALIKPIEEKKLYLYLVVSEKVVSAVLIREEEKVQWSVYYVSKQFLDAETKYPEF